jgi:lysophospholipase L1-like esterase
MKPLKILIFFIAVFGVLFIVSILFPRDGIAIGEDLKLRFISQDDLFKRDSLESTYTDSLIINTLATDDPESEKEDSILVVLDALPAVNHDSLLKVRIDSISSRVYPLLLSDSARLELAGFFSLAENSQDSGELVRILHYGDSQIENDRMTARLRYRFQVVFGGAGCGMVPAVPLYSGNPTFRERSEGKWTRYTGFGKRDSTLNHNSYGVMACFSSIPIPDENELPSLEFNFIKGRRASKFSELKMFLHSYVDSGMIILHINDTIVDSIYPIQDGYQTVNYLPDYKVEKIKIHFDMEEGGRVYGISFDPSKGIQMDNMAMRGSSGMELSRTDHELIDTMMQDLNPGLILMQFGGNVVPYITNTSYYKRAFKRELEYIKSHCPYVPIIVIGPSDMATKENGQLLTYEKLEAVRDALKTAALESGCSFWDMYEAMGGENSIQDFALADPPLANPDYIHFTPKGANMVAGMFFDAVMLEYNRYLGRIQ